jgi:hypothetical protein
MLRRIIRKGIRAFAAGREPDCIRSETSGRISTYCQGSIVRVPQRTNRNDELVLG